MGNALSTYFAGVLASSRRLHDVGMLLITWCGVLAVLGHGQVGLSRRRRLAGVALGVALLILGQLLDGDRRVMARYDTVVRAGRRLLSRGPRLRRTDEGES